MATNSATPAPSPALVVPPAEGTAAVAVPEALRDVKPPVPIVHPWLIAGTLLLLTLLLALLIAWWLRRRRRRKHSPPPKVVVPPHRRARDQLRAALDLLHDPKAFTTRVADTLRVYLEERFDLHAPERTREEFLAEIQDTPVLSPQHKQILADFLTRCDLVKFAQHQPAEPDLRGLLDAALNLVDETAEPSDPSELITA